MIPKSMSRKDQSFGQLIAYMQDDGKSERDYDIYHHCFSRDRHGLEVEFTANSALLPKRKNGNYLYHEIISITLEEGVSLKFAKNSLREIAEEWVQRRCPKNMVYGCLHADHTDHLHYHLMISANELGQSTRLSLTTHAFNKIKRELEAHVLQKYPELKQKAINTATQKEKKLSRKASEQKRRAGKLDRQDFVRSTLREAMTSSVSDGAFQAYLRERNFSFYIRGKNFGVEVLHDSGKLVKYRFSTLGVHEEYEAFMQGILSSSDAKGDKNERAGENKKEAPEEGKTDDYEEQQNIDPNDRLKNGQKPSSFHREVDEIYRKKQQIREEKQKESFKQKPRSR